MIGYIIIGLSAVVPLLVLVFWLYHSSNTRIQSKEVKA